MTSHSECTLAPWRLVSESCAPGSVITWRTSAGVGRWWSPTGVRPSPGSSLLPVAARWTGPWLKGSYHPPPTDCEAGRPDAPTAGAGVSELHTELRR
jgi:hypothetical protein